MLRVLKWRANLGVTVFPVEGGPIAETILKKTNLEISPEKKLKQN